MKLSFQCQQDPKTMSTKQGKKFCDHCQKHVHDLRKKNTAKVISFHQQNPDACVIAYQDQLDHLPAKQIKATRASLRIPFAASAALVALLPTATLAQSPVHSFMHTGKLAIALDSAANKKIQEQKTDSQSPAKYFIEGYVTITDSKTKLKAGRKITVYKIIYDAKGEYLTEKEIASTNLKVNGKFKIEVNKEYFDKITNEESVYIEIDGIHDSYIQRVETDNKQANTAIVFIDARSKRRMVMGAW